MLKKLFLKDNFENSVLKASVLTFSIKLLSVFLSYFFILYISRKFGAYTVGIINIYTSFLTMLSVVSIFGFDQAIIRLSGQFKKKRFLFFSIYKKMTKYIFFVALFVALFVIFSKDILSLIFIKETKLGVMFELIAVGTVFLSLTSFNVETIRGLDYIKESEFFRTFLNNFLNIVLFFLFLNFFEFNLILPIVSNSISIFITFVASTFFILKKINIESSQDIEINEKNDIDFFKISLPIFLVNVASVISNYIPVLSLAYFFNAKSVGIFNIAFKIATVTSFFLVSINSIVAPKIAEFYWNRKIDDLKKIAMLSAKLNFWSSAPILILFIFMPKFFMGVFGKEFLEGYRSLIFLSLGQFINAFCGSVGYLLTMTGHQVVFRNIYLFSTLLNLILCVTLVPILGIDGASLGFSVSMIFWNLASLMYVRKKFGLVTYYIPFIKNE